MKPLLSIILLFITTLVFSKNNTDLNYPELMVSPKASERLGIEAKKEADSSWYKSHLPMLTSASTTLMAGVVQLSYYDRIDDPDKKSALLGIVVGGSWLAINSYMASFYNAYQNSYKENKTMPIKSRRQQLIKERLAEEEINRLARLGNRLKWLSIITNSAAGGYMLSKAKSDSIATATSALSIAAAIGPLIFSNRWIDIAKEQRKYKKKIYAPIVRSTIFSDPKTGAPIPGALISMNF